MRARPLRLLPAALLGLAACGPPSVEPPTRDPSPFNPGEGQIEGLSLSCATDAGRWTLRVRTDAWAATGLLLWGTDPAAVEAHSFGSVQAAANGSADCLSLSLGVEADRAEAVAGVSTRFSCEALEELALSVFVSDTEATVWTDCRAKGDMASAFAGREDVPSCPVALEAAPVAGDTGGADTGGGVEVSLAVGDLGNCP
jgi:hypothetical protein